jgi:TPR repeat protein
MSSAARKTAHRGARLSAALLGGIVSAGIVISTPSASAEDGASTGTREPRSLTAQALALEHGEGIAKDAVKAHDLYCDAAREGDAEAMFNLGWMYANGRGVPRDDAVAASLFTRAAALGYAYAQQMLKYVGPDQGVVPACMVPPPPVPQNVAAEDDTDPFATLPPPKRKIADIVSRAAPTFGIDPRLALAIVAAESDFQPDARSVKDARGVMQLTAPTAARFNVSNRANIVENVRGGLAYLRWLLAYYEGRVRLAVAAYNAGEGAVDKYGDVPPYRETRDYVRRVSRFFTRESHPYDPSIVEPSPAVGDATGTGLK